MDRGGYTFCMKIALIIRRLNVKGGAQRQILELAQELQKRGHTVALYTFAYSEKDCFTDLLQGLRVVVWRGNNVSREEGHALNEPQRRQRNAQFFGSGFFDENRKAKELAMQIDRDTELLHPHDQVAYRVAAYYKRRVRRVPSVWMMNDVPTRRYAAWYARQIRPDAREGILKRAVHVLMDIYDRALFIRQQDAIAVLDEFNRRNVRRFLGRDATVTRSGLDIAAFAYAARTPPDRSGVRLLTTGIFMRHRRFEDIIEAIKILRDRGIAAVLTVIGDQDNDKKYADEVRRLAETRGVAPYISFPGRVSEEDLVAAYRQHHAFIFANAPQTWGLAVFEAQACGTPVIVSRGAGAHEVLTDRENALLVQPRAPREIADAVERLVNDPALYEKLSRQGRAFVEQHMGWGQYADAMEAVFRTVLAKKQ